MFQYHMNIKKLLFSFAIVLLLETVFSQFLNAGWNTEKIPVSFSDTETQILYDKSGNSHLIVYSQQEYRITHLWWTGTSWETKKIESGFYNENYASPSAVFDPDGNIHLSYVIAGDLKYAKWDGATWKTQVIEKGVISHGASPRTGIALKSNFIPAITYFRSDKRIVKYAEWTGVKWSTETVSQKDYSAEGDCSLAFDSNGLARLAYGEYSPTSSLKIAEKSDGIWSYSIVDSGSFFRSGREIELLTDSNDLAHIVYEDYDNQLLKYAKWDGVKWSTHTVDTTGMEGINHRFRLDKAGKPRILYSFRPIKTYDTGLKYAEWTGSAWKIETISPSGPFFSGFALDAKDVPNAVVFESPNIALLRRTTTPSPPYSLGSPKRDTNSITWTWIDNSNDETGFRVLRASDNHNISGDLPMNTTYWVMPSLFSNTTYQINVVAFNGFGESNPVQSYVRSTMAAIPIGTRIVSVSSASITVAWSPNGNDPSTSYYLEKSYDGVDFFYADSGKFLSKTLSPLIPETTYYFRVYARHKESEASIYDTPPDIVVSTRTLATEKYPLGSGNQETVDSVGTYNTFDPNKISFKTDAGGKAHLCYFDQLAGQIKYATWEVTKWSTQTVATIGLANYSSDLSMDLDSNGSPHIFFTIDNLATDSSLKYARKVGENWDVETLKTSKSFEGGISVKIDKNNHPHLSYVEHPNRTTVIVYTKWNGTSWDSETIDTIYFNSGLNYPPISLALNFNNKPKVVYYDDDSGCLVKAQLGSSWQRANIDCSGDWYRYSDIVVHPWITEKTTISSWNNKSGSLILFDEMLHDTIKDFYTREVLDPFGGGMSSIALDSAGDVNVAYYSPIDKDLKLIRNRGPFLSNDTIDSAGDVGRVNRLAIDANGDFHIAYYDASNQTLKYIKLLGSATPGQPKALAISENSITWAWNDNSSNELGFRVYRSWFYNLLARDLPANSNTWIQEGLEPNSAHSVYIQAFTSLKTLDSISSTSTYTLSRPPVDPTISSVNFKDQSVNFAWKKNRNPDGTRYLYELSNDNVSFSTYTITSDLSAVIKPLNFGSTYYFRVKSLNGNDVPSSYSTVLSTFIPWVQDDTIPPNAPGKAIGSSNLAGIAWRWADQSLNELGFRVIRSSDGMNLSGDLPPNTTYWQQINLGPNQKQSVLIEAFNVMGSSKGLAGVGASLPNPPGFPTGSPSSQGVTITWASNGNPEETSYLLEYSQDDVNFAISPTTSTGTSTLISGLSGGATYYFRVRGKNSELDIFSEYTPSLLVFYPLKPTMPVINFEQIKRSSETIVWVWDDTLFENGFKILDPINGKNLSGNLASNTTFWAQVGLLPSTTYQIQVEAFNDVGTSRTSIPSAHLVSTLANPPTGTRLSGISPTSINLSWLANGNPIWTMYRIEGSLDGLDYSSFSYEMTGTSTKIQNLRPLTTYYIRICAMSQDREHSEFNTLLPVFTPNGIDAKGGVLTTETSHAQITLNIPPGAFSSSTAISFQTPLSFPNPDSPVYRLSPTGIGVQIETLSTVKTALPISISLSYRDEDISDFDETKLVLARFDTEKNIWVPLPGSVDASSNEITAKTDQLSLFQIMMLTPGKSVSECKVFPNPFRPSKAGNQFLKFSSLPAGAKLTIYTLRGEMVWEETADDQGNISWDAKNNNNEPVGSGVYYVLLDGSGGKKTIKVVVQR